MAIKKIKWQTLIEQIDAQDILDDTEQELKYIDGKINELTTSIQANELTDLMKYVDNYHLKPSEDLIWYDMDIVVSSWKEKDKRFVLLLKNKLREYIGFYRKILTDAGVQRALVYAKEFENDGNASGLERTSDSQTPQNSNLYNADEETADTLFDQAIANYASGINKNKSSSTSHTEGESSTTVTGTTWEEAKKNIELIFYNELKEYIMSIPERIYSYYSIDTLPAPLLCKKMLEHFEAVKDLLETDE